MNEKVKSVLNSILEKFQTGDIPEAIAYSMFPFPDVPSAKWSLLNRTLMFLSGTMDARGYRQWQHVNRYVKKGSNALYIIVPYLKVIRDELEERKYTLKGFGVKAVFRVEDTEGSSLEYENIELPDVPLMKRAEEWGISVRAIPGNYQYFGYFSVDRKEIAIATNQECVFFHELAHCAHYFLNGSLKRGQEPLQEIIAELSAQTLAIIVGKSAEDTVGKSPYVFLNKYGSPVKSGSMRKHVWNKAIAKIGLEHRTMLQTRHTFITLMLDSGEHIGWIARQVGHTSPKMIFERYYSYIKNYQSDDGLKFMERVYSPIMGKAEKTTPNLPHQQKEGISVITNPL